MSLVVSNPYGYRVLCSFCRWARDRRAVHYHVGHRRADDRRTVHCRAIQRRADHHRERP